MKLYDVCGLGNGLVDILLEIKEEELTELGLEKGTMRLVEPSFQSNLLSKFVQKDTHLVSGGSVANSIVALSQLGAKGAMICSLGDDRYGTFYRDECESLGIRITAQPVTGGLTGTCVSLITPDAERTMRTCLASSAMLSEAQVHEDLIKQSRWLFVEGYIFANPNYGQRAVRRAVTLAKRHGTKIAVTVSEAFIVESFGPFVREIVEQVDLVFANASEACAYAGTSDYRTAFDNLRQQVPAIVVTAGAEGALASIGGQRTEAKALSCKPVDLTGAGDMFAGTFLACITHDWSVADAAKAGCCMAGEVIMQYGARLSKNVQDVFVRHLGRRIE